MTSIEASERSWVLPLCWSAVLLDGFDLVVLGTVLPVLLAGHVWGLAAADAAFVSTIGLVGMTIGALALGTVTEVLGRRRAMIVSVTVFSVCTLLCAFAPSVALFGLLRLLAGLGLGGCLPTAITLVSEHYARTGRPSTATTTVMTGYHVGAMATALLGIALIPWLGWQAMFVVGALPAIVLVPLMIRHLPDSAAPVANRSSSIKDALAVLFRGRMIWVTVAFWITSFMGLILVYGLNTWLPEIMRQAGYPLGAALGLLLTLNFGGVAGLLVAGMVADRVGIKPAALGWFVAAAALLALLSIKLPGFALYVAVFLSGAFVFSAQVLVYAYTTRAYPADARATGLGWTAGIGRIGAICGPLLGGLLLTAGIVYPWGFYAFAVVAALAAVGVAALNAVSRTDATTGAVKQQQ
ncbi:aromatic acid/H+ symport family MFS transporter [Kutzneria buriramensis]|uniref:Putative MFS family arabinose efflux permease n=1 Tax=Kutzneria buriramensis TaxID=1045776 RepID=A0A3E0I032_9PSEU|nr:aromatic acid/H+ symport family MFS transporter [Kutzneria buriramensis]REH51900.1 putative MFS family arabinose efflux permease [Kutzneria buriramensis]